MVSYGELCVIGRQSTTASIISGKQNHCLVFNTSAMISNPLTEMDTSDHFLTNPEKEFESFSNYWSRNTEFAPPNYKLKITQKHSSNK